VRSLGLLVAAALLAILVTACGAGSDDEPTVATTTVNVEEAGSSREPAPLIEGTSLDGGSISLADFRGRPVLINVWSSW
jgi:hypothetical protein